MSARPSRVFASLCVSALVSAGVVLIPAGPSAAATGTAADWASLRSAVTAAADQDTVVLTADIASATGENLEVPASVGITLDLNGHQLRIDSPEPSSPAIWVGPGSAITVVDSSPGRVGSLTVHGGNGISTAGKNSGAAGIGAKSVCCATAAGAGTGRITITDATVSATGGDGNPGWGSGAGIGGAGGQGVNAGSGGGTVVIDGAANVTAKGGQSRGGAAGIGGGSGAGPTLGGSGGSVTIGGDAVVHAVGGSGSSGGGSGAGIGGATAGSSDEPGSNGGVVVVRDDAEVFATGGAGLSDGGSGAGIGGGGGFFGGHGGSGGTLTLQGQGSVTATGGRVNGRGGAGTGVGGGGGGGVSTHSGPGGTGAVLTLEAGTRLVATGGTDTSGVATSVGGGTGGLPLFETVRAATGGFGTLLNAGTLSIPAEANLTVPASAASVRNTGTVALEGALGGSGTLVNDGRIMVSGSGSVSSAVSHRNYAISFDAQGGTPTAIDSTTLYAGSFDQAEQSLPVGLSRASFSFAGWNTAPDGSGDLVDATTDLTTVFADAPGTPTTATLYAQWSETPQSIDFEQPDPLIYGAGDVQLVAAAPGGAVTFATTSTTCVVTAEGVLDTIAAGDCVVTADQAGGDGWAPASLTRTITITRAPLTVTASSGSSVYGSAPDPVTATVDGFVRGEDESDLEGALTCGTSADSSSPAGGYTTSCSGVSSANYDIVFVPGVFAVGKKPVSVTPEFTTSRYGDVPVIRASFDGFVNGDDAVSEAIEVVCTSSIDGTVRPGTYVDVSACTAPEESANYRYDDSATGAVEVGPRVLRVTPRPATGIYGTVPTVTPLLEGFINGDTAESEGVSIACSANTAVETTVGIYEDVSTCEVPGASQLSESGAYCILDTHDDTCGSPTPRGVVEITRRPVVVSPSPDPVTATYGTVPVVTPTFDGFVNGNDESDQVDVTCAVSTTATTAPGTYADASSCTGRPESVNYTYDYTITGDVVIAQKTLVVTASSGAMVFGTAPPSVTPAYTGFLPGDGVAGLDTTPVCSTTATATSPAGSTQTSSCAGGSDDRYAFSYVPGTVTVSKAPVAMTTSSSSGLVSLLTMRITFTATVTHAVTGAPVAGVAVKFKVNTSNTGCTGITNAQGVATCVAQPVSIALGIPGVAYTASSAVTTNYQGGSAPGMIRLL